eukprot:scpid93268/ scgid33755/ 
MDHASENGTSTDLATCSKEELNEALCKSYLGIRNKKKRNISSAVVTRDSEQPPITTWLRLTVITMNIFTDPKFRRGSNQAYEEILKTKRRQGEVNATQSKAIISREDLFRSVTGHNLPQECPVTAQLE